MAWLAAVGGLGAAALYLAAIAAQGGVQDGEGPMVALVAGSFLTTAGACAAAAMTRRRRPAVVLLALALVPPLVWGVFAIFSIGVGFLAPAAVVGIALVQTITGAGVRQYPASVGPVAGEARPAHRRERGLTSS